MVWADFLSGFDSQNDSIDTLTPSIIDEDSQSIMIENSRFLKPKYLRLVCVNIRTTKIEQMCTYIYASVGHEKTR